MIGQLICPRHVGEALSLPKLTQLGGSLNVERLRRSGRILSAPTGGVQNGFWEVSREISWRESVAVVVGAACPPRCHNNNLLGLGLGLNLGLGLGLSL